MSSQPEEQDNKKHQNILFRKTNVLGFEVPNVILLLVVLVIGYILCQDSDKKYSAEELMTLKPAFDAFGSNSTAAPTGNQTGGFFGKSNKFQFDY